MSTKAPTNRDVEVGRRIRARRLERGMSQSTLGAKLGVTFQQIQKRERGVNRVSAGDLYKTAEILGVPVSFFFGGAEPGKPAKGDDVAASFQFLETQGAIRVLRAYAAIKDTAIRRAFVALIERVAGITSADEEAPARKGRAA